MRHRKFRFLTLAAVVSVFFPLGLMRAAEWQSEWDSALKGAKKEEKIVLAIPPSAALRKELEPLLKEKFGIEAELVVSRGADSANRIASEYKAGVRTFDGLIQGTTTAMSLQDDGMLDPVISYMILPEVKILNIGGAGTFGTTTSRQTGFFIPLSRMRVTRDSSITPSWQSLKNFARSTIFSIPNGRARSV